ncbi:uncharacterized protein LOC110833871 [Zootermopsis nevadensis]|uniref:Uncharacterized protein n=1 Tax=Zootermopsis nevadensis TaxID=136037 RepID=A0A067R6U2_ZOONE|nr:uncharacterized protein LOC110833871 [Zootermopsis nevadensis]KDR15143.1 hypothetical protein L798_10863 [Zootermopsis nevadensis]
MKHAVGILLLAVVFVVVTAAPSDLPAHQRDTRQAPSIPSPGDMADMASSLPGADKFKLPKLPTPEEAAIKVLENVPEPLLEAAESVGEAVEGFMPSESETDAEPPSVEDIAAKGMEQAGKIASKLGIGSN